jgi:hypothetical protein
MSKDPTTATLLSIVPGLGQIYTHQYFKAGLFVAAGGFFASRAIYHHIQFADFSRQFDALTPADSNKRFSIRSQRESYRDSRDESIFYFVAVEVLSMIDAYVDAHLFDFDVSDEGVSSKLIFDPMRPGIGVQMRW